ncbi:MAG: SEC-C domain-containing protein [Deltaproteobacteria bacterium]|nr:SEC-C domain-containing protein [Deltaproteobacteria bacterium]
MHKIGRNEACPCGSGKKFKNCHMGREEELWVIQTEKIKTEIAQKITDLPEVAYGRSKEFAEALDIKKMTKNPRHSGVKFVDFDAYVKLEPFDKKNLKAVHHQSGAFIVNPKKTENVDAENIYVAITPGIDNSSLIHELAHVLDFLGGSGLLPGSASEMSVATQIPMDQLDHLKEYGDWLDCLKDRFAVDLNAEDMIIAYLNKHDMLIEASLLKNKDIGGLISRSQRMTEFLVRHKDEIHELIKDRIGYLGGVSST